MICLSKLDLGRSYEDCCKAPFGCGSSPSKSYPTIWVDNSPKPVDLPKKGKAVVDYEIVSKTTRERDGKTTHDASIEIRTIESVEDGKKKAGSAKPVKLQALRPGMIAFSRDRNQDGEFAPQSAGTPDPKAMAAAYGPGVIAGGFTKGAIEGAGAVAGGGGAALLARLAWRRLRRR